MLEAPRLEFGWRRAPAEADLLGSSSGTDEKSSGLPRLAGMCQHLSSVVAAVALLGESGYENANARVLDMCAAPGGKTTAIAAGLLLSASSPPSSSPSSLPSVLSLDRTAAKATQIASLAAEMGVSEIVTACVADSMKLFSTSRARSLGEEMEMKGGGDGSSERDFGLVVDPGAARSEEARLRKEARKAATRARMGAGRKEKKKEGGGEEAVALAAEEEEKPRPLPPPPTRLSLAPDPSRLVPGSFSHVLLDAPCSGLGLRPRLAQHADRAFVARAAAVQRALLAVAVVAAGGEGEGGEGLCSSLGDNFGARTGGARIVYSTCSISPEENEAVVAAALRKWPRLVLEDARGALPAGVAGPGLSGEGPSLAAFRDGGKEGRNDAPAMAAFLPPNLAPFVLRFDPAAARQSSGSNSIGGCDTIGFFVAVFSVAPLVPRGGWAARVVPATEDDDGDGERESGGARSGVEALSLLAV